MYCSTNQKLVAVLAGAKVINDCPFTCLTLTTADAPTELTGVTNGVTAVDLCAAAAGIVKHLSIENADTAAVTVTVKFNDNGTLYILKKVTLPVGATLVYDNVLGWSVGSRLSVAPHGLTHVDGTDDIQDVTTAVHGKATTAMMADLDGSAGIGFRRHWNLLTDKVTVVAGTWVALVTALYLYNALFCNSSNTLNDEMNITFRCPQGTYKLRFNSGDGGDRGIVTLYIDGVSIGTYDRWAVSKTYLTVIEITGIALSAGLHTLTFKATGKTGTGYLVILEGISLVRTA